MNDTQDSILRHNFIQQLRKPINDKVLASLKNAKDGNDGKDGKYQGRRKYQGK
jgi:hypothetical protein